MNSHCSKFLKWLFWDKKVVPQHPFQRSRQRETHFRANASAKASSLSIRVKSSSTSLFIALFSPVASWRDDGEAESKWIGESSTKEIELMIRCRQFSILWTTTNNERDRILQIKKYKKSIFTNVLSLWLQWYISKG